MICIYMYLIEMQQFLHLHLNCFLRYLYSQHTCVKKQWSQSIHKVLNLSMYNDTECRFEPYSEFLYDFFSPIKSTDTGSALLVDIKPRFTIQPVVSVFFRESLFRQSVLLSRFWVPWVKFGYY